MIKNILLFSITFCFATNVLGQFTNSLQAFPLSNVRLLESTFKKAQQKDFEYLMALDADRLLYPYLREAGLPTKAKTYPNWEATGLDGHIGGHYLSALSLMYASTGDKRLDDRITYMLSQLKRCQEANGNGYLGGVPGSKTVWQQIASGQIQADPFSLNKKWVPLYNIHKMYAGLRDAYLIAGKKEAKEMLIRFTDWMVSETKDLTDAQVQSLLVSEQGGLNEIFADVYGITRDIKYLALAKRFSHQTILQPLAAGQDKLNGLHANMQIPKVIGFKRIADFSPADSSFDKAAHFFWEDVVGKRTVAIGGNSVREHFNPASDFSSMINDVQGPETCNTYNMLKLTKELFLSDGAIKYMDYYERALYNHILSTENLEKGGFVYFTPMRPGHYRVYSQPETSMWCCVGSGIENHGKYGEMIYAHSKNDLFVNLFIPSQLEWKEKGLILTQLNHFPEEEGTGFTIDGVKAGSFGLNIRYPSWVKAGELKVQVNGKEWPVVVKPGAYVSILRSWKKGDKVQIKLPMQTTSEKLPDGSHYVAILHGPIVLAAATDTANQKGLYADDSRGGHIASGKLIPLSDMPYFVTNSIDDIAQNIKPVAGRPLHFTAENLIQPASFKNLQLLPFYRLHDTRYLVYWQQLTSREVTVNEEKLKAQKMAEQQLMSRTLDLVYAGEQQPESDHFVQSSRSSIGVFQDRHFRDAREWFSYQLKDEKGEAVAIRLTYYGRDKDRHFYISINGTQVADVQLEGTKGDSFYTMDYSIPADIINAAKGKPLTVRFNAAEQSIAGGIYEIRLLRKE